MSAVTTGSLTTTGSVTHPKSPLETSTYIVLSGTYGTVTLVLEGSYDGTNYVPLAAVSKKLGTVVTGTLSPTDNEEIAWVVPSEHLASVRARVTAIASGTAEFTIGSNSFVGAMGPLTVSTSGTLAASTMTGDLTMSGAIDLAFSGTTGQSEVTVTDNLADALSVKIAGGSDLIVLRSTDSDEAVQFPNNVEFYGDSGTKKVVSVGSTSVAETLTVATGEYETRLTDNLADAWSVKVASGADLLVFKTTDSAEQVTIPNNLGVGSNATDRVNIKGIYMNPSAYSLSVPTIADAEVDVVAADVSSAFAIQPAVGDAVIAIPAEALPTDCILMGAYVTNTDEISVTFGAKEGGSGVTGASKNFYFLVIDLT